MIPNKPQMQFMGSEKSTYEVKISTNAVPYNNVRLRIRCNRRANQISMLARHSTP